ncbi:MAG TPA: vWA domain-containing protein [Pyrinomonadaceae bacterium]|nr:vWA domain-containing protein [Pyrinomonadaceae bacterium]
MQLDSQNATIVVMPQGGLISGDRVAAHPRAAGAARLGLLTVFPGQAVERGRPVRVLPLEQVPEGVLAVGADLAEALGMLPVERASWRLNAGGMACQQAEELLLEVTVQHQLEEVVDQLNRSEDLAERLLWVPGGLTGQPLVIEVGGRPYRVRELHPPVHGDAIVEVTTQTNVKVFAPGYTSGIDIVILADCSGSMTIPDLTDDADAVTAGGGWNIFRRAQAPAAGRSLTRASALQRALHRLLETRLRVSGRTSRIALVSFTTETAVRFPRGGGMQEVDENAAPEVVQQFRDAVNLLQAERAGTDIGQAIYDAAELLYRHGRPGNDRLIVLISDGANWKPKGQEATGEMVAALQEPVSLVEHLHREMKIHLHAIGISTHDIFMRYFNAAHPGRVPDPSAIPNHQLLEQLVLVGGGDPTQTGDTGVLQRYLTGLGAGVTRHLRRPQAAQPPPLGAEEAKLLAAARRPAARAATRADVLDDLRRLKDEIKELRKVCNGYTSALIHRPMFKQTDKLLDAVDYFMVTEVQSPREFELFINNLNQCFCEAVDDQMYERDVKGTPPPIPAVTDVLHGPDMGVISDLRNYLVHDKTRALTEPPPDGRRRGHRRDPKADHQRFVEVLQRLVRAGFIEDNDAERWSLLQRGVLTTLRDVLTTIRDEFKRAEAAEGARPAAAPTGQSDFVLKW